MRVLVTAASKHGATAEIADAIGRGLTGNGITAVVLAPEEVNELEGFDAVVVGSAVYAGHWLDAAKELVERLGPELRNREVWLFSSGPVGDPLKPEEDPVDVAAMREATSAVEHRLLAGRLDRSLLGFAEKAIVMALRAPEGDFRDWEEIAAWSEAIARALPERTEP